MRVRITWIWLVPVLLLTTFLGTVLLTYDALWFDEWITGFISNTGEFGADSEFFGNTTVTDMPVCQNILSHEYHSVLHTICIGAIDNSWPPLFFLLIMLWDFLIGSSYFLNRTLALFIGLVGVSITYRMAGDMFDKKTGFIAALLLGTTVFFTFYLHEIRGYTLYVTLPALNGWLYWRLLKKKESGRAIGWGFALSIVGTLYTHYIGIAVVFGIGLYHILFERPANILQEFRLEEEERSKSAQQWIRILKLYINGCLTYGLWLAVLYISFINESSNPRGIGIISLLRSMLQGFSNNLWFIALPAIALTLLQLKKDSIRFLWVWGLSILAISIAGNLAADFLFHPRHIMGLMPVFATLVAVGIVYAGQRSTEIVSWGLVAVWIIAGIFYGLSTDFMNNIPEHIDAVPLPAMTTIVETAESCGRENDTFIFAWNTEDEEWVQDQIVTYYLHNAPVRAVTTSRILDDSESRHESGLMPDEINEAGVEERYDYFVADAERVFLFALPEIPVQDRIQEMETRLESDGFVRCDFINRNDLVADIFVRDAEMCETIVSSCEQ